MVTQGVSGFDRGVFVRYGYRYLGEHFIGFSFLFPAARQSKPGTTLLGLYFLSI